MPPDLKRNPPLSQPFASPRSALAALFLVVGSLLVVPGRGADPGSVPEVIAARVIRVRDGDSLLVRAAGKDIEVRLADVDAPERGQPHADQARKALIDLLQRRDVSVEVLDTDQYHRKVARVRRLPDGLDINAEVVRKGNAWVYLRYVRDQSLFALEREAKARHLGLWALAEPQRIPPWVYRQRERRSNQAPSATSP